MKTQVGREETRKYSNTRPPHTDYLSFVRLVYTHNLWHNRKQHNYLCQRRIFSASPALAPFPLSLSLYLFVSQVANGQLNCLFSAIRTFKYFKSRGQLCNFLDCATKPNDKFNAPLVLGPAEQSCGKALPHPCPCHMLKTNKKHIETPLECVVCV